MSGDHLARFAFDRADVKVDQRSGDQFLPPRAFGDIKKSAMKVSVSIATGRSAHQVTETGLAVLKERRRNEPHRTSLKLYGYGMFWSSEFEDMRHLGALLSVERSPTLIDPHHGDIVGWPDDTSARLDLQQALSQRAVVTAFEPAMASGD